MTDHQAAADTLKAALGSWSARLTEQDYRNLIEQGFDSPEALLDARDKTLEASLTRPVAVDTVLAWQAENKQSSVPPKVLDVHVLVNSQEDLSMNIEYDVPTGVIRYRDFQEALGIKVLKYALSTNDAAPGTEDYKVAVGTKALPPNITSL